MSLLGLPYEKTDAPLVTLVNGELLVDLLAEEKTLYSSTLFAYTPQQNIHSLPSLRIKYSKILSPRCLVNTIKIVLYQSELIASPQKAVERAKEFIQLMPERLSEQSLQEVDVHLSDTIWPSVIAVGALCEFYSRLIEQELTKSGQLHEVLGYIGSQVALNDWFFTSLSHQSKVREGKMTFDEYLEHYGIRARKDYEIACPRWYEERDELHKHMFKNIAPPPEISSPGTLNVAKKVDDYVQAVIRLQILRSEARRRALLGIDALRKHIVRRVGKEMEYYSRDDLLQGSVIPTQAPGEKTQAESQPVTSHDHGKGMAVSAGEVTGPVFVIRSPFDEIPSGSVGIFPNSSTDFTMLYPKCAGIIFLSGGQTSHGAIVAREFKIPALVASDAVGLADGTMLQIDGKSGTWKRV